MKHSLNVELFIKICEHIATINEKYKGNLYSECFPNNNSIRYSKNVYQSKCRGIEMNLTKEEHEKRLMTAVDLINQKLGKNMVGLARTKGKLRPWESKQNQLSPSYTTEWKDIPNVKC